MNQKVTIVSLAKAAGVSPATVSLVLNKHPLSQRISAAVRTRILELAESVHYRPNALAKGMVRQRTGLIGFVCGNIEMPYYASLCKSLSLEAERRGYHLLTLLSGWDYERELDALELIYSKMVDGIAIVSDVFSTDNPRLLPFRKPDMPLVVCSECVSGDCCNVSPDFRIGMEALFVDLEQRGVHDVAIHELPNRLGKGDIAVMCGEHHGIHVRRLCYPYAQDTMEAFIADLQENLPDVLIASSDWMCMQAVSMLVSHGVRVPDDISCVSIDGTAICKNFNPGLASVNIDFNRTASAAMDIIIAKLGDHRVFEHRTIPTSFSRGPSLR